MPSFAAFLGWALVGWCGTVPRGWPPKPPDPDPWGPYMISTVIGIVGGVAGGWVFAQLFSVDLASAAGLVVSFVGAFAGSRIVGDIGRLAMPGRG